MIELCFFIYLHPGFHFLHFAHNASHFRHAAGDFTNSDLWLMLLMAPVFLMLVLVVTPLLSQCCCCWWILRQKSSVQLITPSLPILSFLVMASPPRLKVGPIHSLLRCDVTIRRYVAWMAGGHSPIFIYLSTSINRDFAKAAGASVIDKR